MTTQQLLATKRRLWIVVGVAFVLYILLSRLEFPAGIINSESSRKFSSRQSVRIQETNATGVGAATQHTQTFQPQEYKETHNHVLPSNGMPTDNPQKLPPRNEHELSVLNDIKTTKDPQKLSLENSNRHNGQNKSSNDMHMENFQTFLSQQDRMTYKPKETSSSTPAKNSKTILFQQDVRKQETNVTSRVMPLKNAPKFLSQQEKLRYEPRILTDRTPNENPKFFYQQEIENGPGVPSDGNRTQKSYKFPLQEENTKKKWSVLGDENLLKLDWPEWTYKHALMPWAAKKNVSNEEDESDVSKKRLPTVLCIGAKKCGTTALKKFSTFLHPNLVTGEGESHFFDTDKYEMGFAEYRSRMENSSKGDAVLDKTPKYMFDSLVPGRVRSWNSDVKLIAVLCDPVLRAYSDYIFMLAGKFGKNVREAGFESFDHVINASLSDIQRIEENPRETLGYATFQSFVRNAHNIRTYHLTLLTIGMYYYHLLDWYNYFSPQQLHIIDGENLIKNPYLEIKKVENFLNLKDVMKAEMFYYDKTKKFYCVRKNGNETLCLEKLKGNSRKPGSTLMSKTTRKKLAQYFKPHNEKLFKLLGRKFDWT